MKTKAIIYFLIVIGAMLIGSCTEKQDINIHKSTGPIPDSTPDPTGYVWTYNPEMRSYPSNGVCISGSGVTAIWEYKGSFSLNCFSPNPGSGPFYMASVYDKDGISGSYDDVIYADMSGANYWYNGTTGALTPNSVTDHTGFDMYVSNGRLYFSLRTMDVVTSGCPIKYMPAVYTGNKMIWAHLPGNIPSPNDIVFDRFKSGTITNLNN